MAEDPGAFYRPASLKLPEKAPLLQQGLFTKATRDPMLAASYRDCYGPPNVSSLDEYSEGGAGSCLKKYSNPDFFLERWLQHEQERLQEEKNRRAKRRKKKKKRKKEGRNAAAKVQVKAVQKVARSGLGAEFDADTSAQSPSSRAHGRRGSSMAYERVDARDFNAQRPRRRSSRGLSVESMGISFTGDIAKEQASPVSTPPAAAPAPAPAPSPVRSPLNLLHALQRPRCPHAMQGKLRRFHRAARPRVAPSPKSGPGDPACPRRETAASSASCALADEAAAAFCASSSAARGAPPQAPPQRAAPPPAVRTVPDSDAFTPPPPPATNASPPHVPLSRVAMANSAQGYDAPSSAADSYAPPEVEVRRPSAFEIDEPARAAAVERVDPASDPRFAKYVRMQKMGLPQGAIRQAMERDGLDPEELFGSGGFGADAAATAAAPPPAAAAATAARPPANRSLLASIQQGKALKKAPAPAAAPAKPAPSSNPLLAAIRGGTTLKKTTPVERPKVVDPRANMLAMPAGRRQAEKGRATRSCRRSSDQGSCPLGRGRCCHSRATHRYHGQQRRQR